MKQIMLKPEIKLGEAVLYQNKEYRIGDITNDCVSLCAHDNDSLCVITLKRNQLDIIEAQEEQSTGDKTSPTDQVADTGKVIEEKPPLKLRVGVVYRTREGNIVKIVSYDPTSRAPYQYRDESGIAYYEDGIYCLKLHGKITTSLRDLIEEVPQEEKELVEYCKCFPACSSLTTNNQGDNICSHCKKPFGNRKPEGNPFKVGEKVFVYDYIKIKGIIIGIGGLANRSEIVAVKFDDGSKKDYHYKQCERVEG